MGVNMNEKYVIRRVEYDFNNLPITFSLLIPSYVFTFGYCLGSWTIYPFFICVGVILLSIFLEVFFRRKVWYEKVRR